MRRSADGAPSHSLLRRFGASYRWRFLVGEILSMVNVIADQPAAPVRRATEGPWRTAWRKLKRDRSALAAFGVLVVIVIASLAAPLYARYVSGTDPFDTNLNGEIVVDGMTAAGAAALDRRPRPRHDADRADLAARPLSARCRQPGPRRRGAAALRRAQFAADRRGRGRALSRSGDVPRGRFRLLRRPRRYRPVAHPRRALGLSDLSCWRSRSRSC